MELVYNMLLPAFTGIMVSFLVAKLVAMALRCEQVSVDEKHDDFRHGVEDSSRDLIEENYDSNLRRMSAESSSARDMDRFKKNTTATAAENRTLTEQQRSEVAAEPSITGVSVSAEEKRFADSCDESARPIAELPQTETDLVDSAAVVAEETDNNDKIDFTQTPPHAAADHELGCHKPDVTKEEEEEVLLDDSGLDSVDQTCMLRSCEVSSLTQGTIVVDETAGLDTEAVAAFLSDQQGINDEDKAAEQEVLVVAPTSESRGQGFNDDETLKDSLAPEELGGDLASDNVVTTDQGCDIGSLSSGKDENNNVTLTQPVDDDDDIPPSLESLSNDDVVTAAPQEHEMVLDSAETKTEENSDQADRVSVQAETGSVREEEGEGIDLEINSDTEEWEGIERSELERDFARAVNFVQCGTGDTTGLLSDVIMQLYALQKIAMEGPCHESAPMALKLSARAKWNAWNDLGSMSPEEAMERYMSILSDKVPGWMNGQIAVKEGRASTSDDATPADNNNNSSKENTDSSIPAVSRSEGKSPPSEKDDEPLPRDASSANLDL